MSKLGNFVTKNRFWIFFVIIIFIVLSFFGINATEVNYDLSKYLSNDTDTKHALEIMNDEFELNSDVKIMFKNISIEEANTIKIDLEKYDEVLLVSFNEEQNYLQKDGQSYALFNLTLYTSQFDIKSQQFVNNLEDYYSSLNYDFALGGSVVKTMAMNNKILNQIPIIMGVAIVIILGILLLTSSSWIEPLIFFIVLAVSILINVGTNFIFDTISYITNTVQAILQLALAMDYSIILLNNYNSFKNENFSAIESAKKALERSLIPIFSSALTTIAGLSALLFMSFTIGFDIGMVLSKGIIISMLCVFFLMPGLLIVFDKLLDKTKHKKISLGHSKISNFALKFKKIIIPTFVVLIAGGFILQTNNQYSFSYTKLEGEQKEIVDLFGDSNTIVALIPLAKTNEDYQKQIELKNYLENLKIENEPVLLSYTSLATSGAIDIYTPESLANLVDMDIETISKIFQLLDLDKNGVSAKMLVSKLSATIFSANNFKLSSDEILSYLNIDSSDVTYINYLNNVFNSMQVDKTTIKDLANYIISNDNYLKMIPENYQELILLIAQLLNNDKLINQIYDLNNQIDFAFKMFNGDNYSRILMSFNIKTEDKRATLLIENLKNKLNELYGEDNFLAGGSMTTYDISKSFNSDVLKVNLITIVAIFIIICLSFRSLMIPIILVFVIQGSIWISMSFSFISNEPIFFMAYLICLCIQMGATIDYGIIMCESYLYSRKSHSKNESIQIALKKSLPSILTSGSILVISGFIIGLISTELTISSIGLLLGRGTLVSILLVLFLLPSLLLSLDKLILKTTINYKDVLIKEYN